MLYYLSLFKDDISFLNIFNYITFRTGAAIATSFFLSLLVGPWLVAKLRALKIAQIERQYGPASHLAKNGTPTMGGLLILISLLSSVLLWARLDNPYICLVLFTTVCLAFAGILDDYTKLIKHNPEGLASSVKLTIQLFTAVVVVGYLALNPPNGDYTTSLSIPYLSSTFIDLSVFYFAFSMLVIVGSSNATNLTDGLDGLASGCMVFAAVTYAVFSYLAGNINFADYLKIIYVPGAGELTVFLGALIGACLGFLWFNAYPASVFMGDTSSLFLGGVLGTIALCVKQELLLPIAGGIFVLETISVMLQMGYFKLTHGKRLFKMAPIHHHFELCGVPEPKVIVRFWITGAMLMLLALASLKIR